MKTYTDRKPPFLWVRQHPSEVYIVLNAEEATEYGNRFSTLRQKVRARAEQVFMRDATPKRVKICGPKGKELNVIERTPTMSVASPELKMPAQPTRADTTVPSRRKRQAEGGAKKRSSRQAKRISSIKFLTREQIKQFFGVINNPRDKALFLLIYKRGLRASEPGELL